MWRIMFIGTALLALFAPLMAAQNEVTLDRGRTLCGNGDFERGIEVFDRIGRESSGNGELVAQALIERARCSVLRGQAAARASYERTIREYADQPDAVADARGRLSALPAPAGRPAVYTVDIDSSAGTVRGPATRLTQAADAVEQYPTWSPDGKSIAYRRGPSARGAPTVIVRSLANGEEKAYDGQREAVGPSLWLKSGQGLLSIPTPMSAASGDLQALIASATAAAARGNLSAQELQDLVASISARGTQQPSTRPTEAPQGAQPTPAAGEIYRNDFQGPSQRLGSLGFAIRPANVAVAPIDQRLYAYVISGSNNLMSEAIAAFDLSTGRPAGNFALNADVAPLARSFPSGGHFIAASPDGSRLAITRRPGEFDAYIAICGVATEGKDCRTLVPNAGPLLAVAWTADGNGILYARSLYGVASGEVSQIMRVPVDGGKPAFTGLEVRGMTYFDLNPSGTLLAFDGIAYTISPTNSKEGRQ